MKKTHPKSKMQTAHATSNLARGKSTDLITLQMEPIPGSDELLLEVVAKVDYQETKGLEQVTCPRCGKDLGSLKDLTVIWDHPGTKGIHQITCLCCGHTWNPNEEETK